MRLFIALDIDSRIRESISAYVHELQRQVHAIRFVGPDSYHVTLKFLGEVRDLDKVKRALDTVRARQFPLEFSRSGFFPNERAPRVFWTGIQADDRLLKLAKTIDDALFAVGFAREDRPFRAHLTLARSGSGSPRPRRDESPHPGFRALVDAVQRLPAPEFGTMTASDFFLYESKLSPEGARYTKLARYPLHQDQQ